MFAVDIRWVMRRINRRSLRAVTPYGRRPGLRQASLYRVPAQAVRSYLLCHIPRAEGPPGGPGAHRKHHGRPGTAETLKGAIWGSPALSAAGSGASGNPSVPRRWPLDPARKPCLKKLRADGQKWLFPSRRGPVQRGVLPCGADVDFIPRGVLVRGCRGFPARLMQFSQICSDQRFCNRGLCLRMCAVFPAPRFSPGRTPWLLEKLSTF